MNRKKIRTYLPSKKVGPSRAEQREALKQAVENTQPVKEHRMDFTSHEDRDNYFRDNADYFTVVKKTGVGVYDRDECKSLADAEALAKTKQTIGGGSYMIYAVIGEQSAFVKAIR